MPWGWIFAQIMGDRRSTKIAKMMILCWHLIFLPPRSNLLPHAFVWAINIYIESIKVTCRSTVVKIVLIGNLRWLSSCLYLLYFPATVLFTCIKSWFFRNHLVNFPQISHWSYCCDDRIGKMLHNICLSAVVMSLRWASCGPWASSSIISLDCSLGDPSTKTAQTILLSWTRWPPELKIKGKN